MRRRARPTDAAWVAVVVASAAMALVGLGWLVAVAYRAWPLPAPVGSTTAPSSIPVEGAPGPHLGAPPIPSAAEPSPAALVATLRKKTLTIPVAGVTRDVLQPSFHEPRGTRPHEALDIPAPVGTPVLAVDDGTIARLFTSPAGGLTIYQFDSAGVVAYYYAHLDRYADGLVEGAHVTGGDVLGQVGITGNANSEAPHLHFAIFRLGPERRWWEGEPLDPYEVFVSPSAEPVR